MGESRKERRPRAGSGGGWGLFALCGGHSVTSQQTTAVSPLSLCRHLDIHTVYPAVCSEARLAAGTKVLIARGGEGAGTPFGWRADSQRKIPSRAVPTPWSQSRGEPAGTGGDVPTGAARRGRDHGSYEPMMRKSWLKATSSARVRFADGGTLDVAFNQLLRITGSYEP